MDREREWGLKGIVFGLIGVVTFGSVATGLAKCSKSTRALRNIDHIEAAKPASRSEDELEVRRILDAPGLGEDIHSVGEGLGDLEGSNEEDR